MKFLALAVDYDGTIAFNDVMDERVRHAIADLRAKDVVVLIVTGRILSELKRVAGDLHFVDAVVAENGAVLEFTSNGYSRLLAPPVPEQIMEALRHEGIPFQAGECLIDLGAETAPNLLALLERLELPLTLCFNHNRLMVLPQAVSKATGLREALKMLRLSPHNTVAIGDAENDHVLLRAAEYGVAVAWGSEALKSTADFVLPGKDPSAVAGFLESMGGALLIPKTRHARRRLQLGYTDAGDDFSIALQDGSMLIAGDAKSGKSWVTGLISEQLILFGYSLFIIDPEGDYTSLEALPGVCVYGGADPLPRPRDLLRLLRHADTSIVIDLSHTSHEEKVDYVHALLSGLILLRQQTGIPHRIVIDEAHYFLGDANVNASLDLAHGPYILVSYRPSWMPTEVLHSAQTIIVTCESSPVEVELLRSLCSASPGSEDLAAWARALESLTMSEAMILPITAESLGEMCRIHLSPRLTPHARHAAKYVDIPVPVKDEFIFWQDGQASGPRVSTLRAFTDALPSIKPSSVIMHFRQHDFSNWIRDVFGDYPLARTVLTLEDNAGALGVPTALLEICDAIRARYDFIDPLSNGAQPRR